MDVEPIPIVNRINLSRDPPRHRKRRPNKPRAAEDRSSDESDDEPSRDDHQLDLLA